MKQMSIAINEKFEWLLSNPELLVKLMKTLSHSIVHRDNTISYLSVGDKINLEDFEELAAAGVLEFVEGKGARIPVGSCIMQPYPDHEDQLVYPWDNHEFIGAWQRWRDYRKDQRFKKYTLKGEQAQLHGLHNDTQGNMDMAIAAIDYSIKSNWKGVHVNFEVRNNYGKKQIDNTIDALEELGRRVGGS